MMQMRGAPRSTTAGADGKPLGGFAGLLDTQGNIGSKPLDMESLRGLEGLISPDDGGGYAIPGNQRYVPGVGYVRSGSPLDEAIGYVPPGGARGPSGIGGGMIGGLFGFGGGNATTMDMVFNPETGEYEPRTPAGTATAGTGGGTAGGTTAGAGGEPLGGLAGLLDTQGNIARALWDSYDQFGRPILEDIATEALGPASKAKMASRSGAAAADVEQAFGQSDERLRRELSRYGVNPASGRFSGALRESGLRKAAAKSGAVTGARRDVLAEHEAKRASALAATLGLPQQALAGLGQTTRGLEAAADRALRERAFSADEKAQRGDAVGGLIGTGLGIFDKLGGFDWLGDSIFSDRDLKENSKVVGKLDNGLQVYAYEPKGGGKPMIGLMADEVEKVAPGAVGEIMGLKTVDYGEAVKQHPRKMRRKGQQKRAADTRSKGRQFLRETVPQATDEAVETGTSYFDDAINTASSYFDDAVGAVTPYAEAVAEHTPKFAEWAAGEAREAMEPALAMARPYAEMAGREISRIPEYAEQAGKEIGDFARENLPEDVADFIGFMDAEAAPVKRGRRAAQEKAKAKAGRQSKIMEMGEGLTPQKWQRLMDKVSAMDDTARERNSDVIQMLQSKAPDMANRNRERMEKLAGRRSETDDIVAQTQALIQQAQQGDQAALAAIQESGAQKRKTMRGRR